MAVEIEILGAGDAELLSSVAPGVFDHGVDRGANARAILGLDERATAASRFAMVSEIP